VILGTEMFPVADQSSLEINEVLKQLYNTKNKSSKYNPVKGRRSASEASPELVNSNKIRI